MNKPDVSLNFKLLTPEAVIQDPEFSSLHISKPLEQKQASANVLFKDHGNEGVWNIQDQHGQCHQKTVQAIISMNIFIKIIMVDSEQ